MALNLHPKEKIARLRGELRMGVPVVIHDGSARWLAAAAETLDQTRFAALHAGGAAELVITDWRAKTLKTWGSDGDLARIRLPKEADLRWVWAMADPSDDLSNPLKGPFDIVYDGNSNVHRDVLALCKQAHLLPAAVVAPLGEGVACDFYQIDLDDLNTALEADNTLSHVSSARVPLAVAEDARVHVYRPRDGSEEHYAIEIGRADRSSPVLSRLHSACFTGDLIGSLKCDCGAQLQAALHAIAAEGSGILLYMNQEGRGIGLANKMRAYSLQDQGFDTVEANHRLGFEDDERDFRLGADILKLLGFGAVRLMTNNPAKTAMMEKCGIKVAERVPLKVGENHVNAAYLATKAKKSGHLL